MSHIPMSMEAVMDEERREVLALLERRAATNASQSRRSPSLASAGRSASPLTSPRSPIRSMLAVDGDLEPAPSSGSPGSAAVTNRTPPRSTAPVRSMLNVDSPPLSPSQPAFRSMLDVGDSPQLSPLKPVHSAQSHDSGTRLQPIGENQFLSNHPVGSHPRTLSDSSVKPTDILPRQLPARVDPTSDYQFSDIITSREKPVLHRRGPQGGATPNISSSKRTANAMAEVMRGVDVSNLVLPGHSLPLRGRKPGPQSRRNSNSTHGRGAPTSKSKSPHSRLSARSNSPSVALGRALSPAGQALLYESQGLDMQNAYRRLSDANLARSGGSLSVLPLRKRSDDSSGYGGRLTKDYLSPDGDDLPEDSSEDDEVSSSDDDEVNRGRKAARSIDGDAHLNKATESPIAQRDGRQALSLLAAAEEERIQVASSRPAYHYRSLLDEPEITVTSPSGEKVKSSKASVHPASSFDMPSRSHSRTPWDSDDEAEYTDIRRAQKLSFSMTPIMSTPEVQRSIRIIYRGDYATVQKEAIEDEHRRPRKYLVATDLSDESQHALEWAVGTVLRDGDSLVAIYCVDEEAGIPGSEGQDEPKTPREQAAGGLSATTTSKVLGMASVTNIVASTASAAALSVATTAIASRPGDPDVTGGQMLSLKRGLSKIEEDQHRAVEEITDRITKLLRKTRLQVRVIVEVLHCKNPRHLITEVIDLVNPTLVILGSRGRSALKGVILGSFSNYLVTKSSVPVMVARKRLRKQSKYRRTQVQQVNNLNNPTAKSLANAKVD